MTRAAQADFWQRRSARRAPPPIERRTHIAIADLLRATAKPDWIWMHVPGEYRTEQTAALLKRMGVRPGAFDFLLIGPDGRHYWLEFKRGPRAPLSEAQQQFREGLFSRSVPHGVARSFDDAVAWLKTWDVLRNGVNVQ